MPTEKNEKNEELKPGKVGLINMMFVSVAAIYPMAMAVSNASAAVQYAGLAAPLVPLFGALLLAFTSVPLLEYARIASFAGGYYGLTELGFGITAGKFMGLFVVFYRLFFDSLTATAFAYVTYTTAYVLFNYELPGIYLVVAAILFLFMLYIFTIMDLKIAANIISAMQILQIVTLLVFSAVVILRTPYNTLSAFNPNVAPGGLSGFFLATILAGFLFYTGYEVPLYLSEEGVEPFRNVWRAILYSVILSAVVGTITMYSEVVSMPPDKLSTLASVLNPGLSAYVPYLGFTAGLFFAIVALLGQLMGGVSPGLSIVRDLYALARDRFFGKRLSRWLTRLNKYNVPANAALVNLILGIITTVTMEALMIYYYGLPMGAFYALFLSGSMVVAYWMTIHIINDFALTVFYWRKGILFRSRRNILVAIVAPSGAMVILVYSFYMGYSSLPQPYFSGFIFVELSAIFSLLYVIYLRRRGAQWESYVQKKVRL